LTAPLILSESVEGITTLTLNRPAKRNAFTHEMCELLRAELQRFQDSDNRVLILAANGPVFTAGADLGDPPGQFWKTLPGLGIEVTKPTIAAIEGPVVGMGVAILGFFDLCVAGEDASLLYPEAKVGIAAGLISALSCRIPHKIALELMLLGDAIPARRAYEVGFINRLTPKGKALEEAQTLARSLANNAPLVMAFLKRMVNATLPHSPVEHMCQTQLEVERVANSQDAQEGLLAFREKRRPNFTGQ